MQIIDIPKLKSSLKPSLNWLLVFVPVAVVLRIWPLRRLQQDILALNRMFGAPWAGPRSRGAGAALVSIYAKAAAAELCVLAAALPSRHPPPGD